MSSYLYRLGRWAFRRRRLVLGLWLAVLVGMGVLSQAVKKDTNDAFVLAGGGYTGVEVIAEVQDLAAEILHLYPRCAAQGLRWLLVEAGDQIMRELPPDFTDFTVKELQRRGIEVLTGTGLEALSEGHVRLSNGDEVPARTA